MALSLCDVLAEGSSAVFHIVFFFLAAMCLVLATPSRLGRTGSDATGAASPLETFPVPTQFSTQFSGLCCMAVSASFGQPAKVGYAVTAHRSLHQQSLWRNRHHHLLHFLDFLYKACFSMGQAFSQSWGRLSFLFCQGAAAETFMHLKISRTCTSE